MIYDDNVLELLRRLFFRPTSLSTFNQSNKQTNKDNKEILKKERKNPGNVCHTRPGRNCLVLLQRAHPQKKRGQNWGKGKFARHFRKWRTDFVICYSFQRHVLIITSISLTLFTYFSSISIAKCL